VGEGRGKGGGDICVKSLVTVPEYFKNSLALKLKMIYDAKTKGRSLDGVPASSWKSAFISKGHKQMQCILFRLKSCPNIPKNIH
jgi:hypothetical protein